MSDDADKTPIDGLSPIEMILKKLGEVGADAKLAVTEAREAKGHAQAANGHSQNTYNLQLKLNEHVKRVDLRLAVVERTRIWLPLAAILLAALALLKAW
jgi:hypothetical protein